MKILVMLLLLSSFSFAKEPAQFTSYNPNIESRIPNIESSAPLLEKLSFTQWRTTIPIFSKEEQKDNPSSIELFFFASQKSIEILFEFVDPDNSYQSIMGFQNLSIIHSNKISVDLILSETKEIVHEQLEIELLDSHTLKTGDRYFQLQGY